MKAACSVVTWNIRKLVSQSAKDPLLPSASEPASQPVCFFVSPCCLVGAVLHACQAMLSFICVGRKGCDKFRIQRSFGKGDSSQSV